MLQNVDVGEPFRAYGEISEELTDRIMSEKDIEVLKKLLKCAVASKSISEFESKMNL